jgi:diguanylate cyclase (GGDEF)-like protein
MIKLIYQFLKDKSQGFVFLVGLVLVLLIGVFDYLTTNEYQLDFFYFFPIFIVTWVGSTKAGFNISTFAALFWAIVFKALGLVSFTWSNHFWNTSIELAIFYSFVFLVSELKQYSRKLEELANEDTLTGIANRRAFNRIAFAELNRSRRFGSPFSIIYIDIDNFKAVNDSRGHNAGDTLLQKVASALQENSRNVDTVARMGGDEFAILLPETNAADAKMTTERIAKVLSQFETDKYGAVTFSTGIVAFLEPPSSLEEMISIADRVMYSVKNQGKNNIAFEPWPELKKEFYCGNLYNPVVHPNLQ